MSDWGSCEQEVKQSPQDATTEALVSAMNALGIESCTKGSTRICAATLIGGGCSTTKTEVGCEKVEIIATTISEMHRMLNCVLQQMMNKSTSTINAGQTVNITAQGLCQMECKKGLLVSQTMKVLNLNVQQAMAELETEISESLTDMMKEMMEKTAAEITTSQTADDVDKSLTLAISQLDTEASNIIKSTISNVLESNIDAAQTLNFTCGIDGKDLDLMTARAFEYGIDPQSLMGLGGSFKADDCVFNQDIQIDNLAQQMITSIMAKTLALPAVNEFMDDVNEEIVPPTARMEPWQIGLLVTGGLFVLFIFLYLIFK